jgi:hypothetical protein
LQFEENPAPLSPGQLAVTQVSIAWRSTKYYDAANKEWINIPPGSACLITDVNWQSIGFMSMGRLFSMHNCYDDDNGIPVWCCPV